jgi:pimeloyl-ACP methyl ester carboxylesterase
LRVHPALLESTASETTLSAAVELLIQWAFSAQFPPRQKELAEKRMAETPARVFRGDFLACNAFDVRNQLNEIHLPTLVVCGAEDHLTPVRFSEYLASEIQGAQLKIIQGAGHMVMLEKPAAVAEIMRGFLKAIS